MNLNKEKLQAGVAQARTVSNLFRKEMDVTAFHKGLEEADAAIHSLKVAIGVATNYPTGELYGGIKQLSQENLRKRLNSGKITIGEDDEDDDTNEAPIPTPTMSPYKATILGPGGGKGITPQENVSRTMAQAKQQGGRRYRSQKRTKHRASTHKRRRI